MPLEAFLRSIYIRVTGNLNRVPMAESLEMLNFVIICSIGLLGLLSWSLFKAVRVRNAKDRHVPRSTSVSSRARLTKHAEERMVSRGVRRGQLDQALDFPDRCTPDAKNKSVRFEKEFAEGTLKVWIVDPAIAGSEIVVKTTAWTHVVRLDSSPVFVGRLVGTAGANVKAMERQSGARITVSDIKVTVRADNALALARGVKLVRAALEDCVRTCRKAA